MKISKQEQQTLLEKFKARPAAPSIPGKGTNTEFTKKLECSSSKVEATINDLQGTITDGTAFDFLKAEGLDPKEWAIKSFRKSQWDGFAGPMESVRFSFERLADSAEGLDLDVEGLLEDIKKHKSPKKILLEGSYGFIVGIGDLQVGKIDGDGDAGCVYRAIECIDAAAVKLEMYRRAGYDIGHVHVAWLGDHIEGFVSQGGANAWRTQLPLNDQIRIIRRIMLYALKKFAPLATRVSMIAVPGNHGEAVRFGNGITRYDDSHDTESLIAISDAVELNPEAFGHVEFYVPDTDELIVELEVAGTHIAHHHGHKWRPNQHFKWWEGQAFNRDSKMHYADLLLSGHTHHEHIESNGNRLFISVPALESESTWFRHNTGIGGAPGILTALTKNGQVHSVDFLRGTKL